MTFNGTVTTEQATNALSVIKAIADTIKELKEVPSGHLYAQVMNNLSIHAYEKIIEILVNSGLVKKDSSHLLSWIG